MAAALWLQLLEGCAPLVLAAVPHEVDHALLLPGEHIAESFQCGRVRAFQGGAVLWLGEHVRQALPFLVDAERRDTVA